MRGTIKVPQGRRVQGFLGPSHVAKSPAARAASTDLE